ncbi:MAG: polyisoprenoid-binding protein YceI [Arenicella sp.]|jgi:polyisoprenoid-binding protein YceI
MLLKIKAIAKLFIMTIALIANFLNLAIADELSSMPSGKYAVDRSHASVVFKVDHLGFSTYVGRFTEFSADLSLNSQEFSKSSVKVEIKIDSITTDYPFIEKEDFDKKLSEQWFKSKEFPNMSYVSKSVSQLSDGKAEVEGKLTMLGETLPVTLNIVLNKAAVVHPVSRKATVGFSAKTKINRTAWGLKNYAPLLGPEVFIEIEGEFVHQP